MDMQKRMKILIRHNGIGLVQQNAKFNKTYDVRDCMMNCELFPFYDITDMITDMKISDPTEYKGRVVVKCKHSSYFSSTVNS